MHPGAGAYICGEETALIEALEGKRGFPRIKPPFFPAVTGLYGEPTVVNNVETMSNLPWIINNGGAAFAALGGGRSTGTRLFALAGRVNNPGVYEIEMVKNTFRDLIYDPRLGGGIIDDKTDQGHHPRWRLGAVVRSRPARPAARPGRGRREGLDARLGLDRRDGRDDLRRARGVADHEVLLARVLRPVHAVPRGFGLDRARDVPHSNTAAVASRTSTSCSTSATTSHRVSPGRPSRRPSASRASIPSSVHSAIQMFRDDFVAHVDTEGAPMTDVIKTTVTITVNGRSIEAQPGELLIEVAERAGPTCRVSATTREWSRSGSAACAWSRSTLRAAPRSSRRAT